MHELTYRDYIKYLEIKMSKMSIDSLTSDETKYFNLIKKQLEAAPTLPSYILDEPLLSSKDYDIETLAAISEITETVSIHGRIKNIMEMLISNISRQMRELVYFFQSREVAFVLLVVFGGVIIAFLLFSTPMTSTSSTLLSGSAGLPTVTPVSPDSSIPSSSLPNSFFVLFGTFLVSLIIVALINRKK